MDTGSKQVLPLTTAKTGLHSAQESLRKYRGFLMSKFAAQLNKGLVLGSFSLIKKHACVSSEAKSGKYEMKYLDAEILLW